MTRVLSVRGAREHNLRGVDLDLPLGQWISVVGPSGSGKTSLVFDTIVREGQRRFLGALSARARHFYGKLGRAKVDDLRGVPAAIAIGQHTATDNVRSTVGTLTGGLDLLRLLFARVARDPGGTELTRGHFSFNNPLGACETCQGLGLEDRVDPELLIADPTKSLRAGALVPTLKSGYTVYSQVTLGVMDQICRAHGFDVETPWNALTDEQRDVIFFGTQALTVPFGKHPIESRMRWEGITARPREEGYYRGLVPVIEETLKRNRNPNILRFVRSVPCAACAGSRLARPGREAQLGEWHLPQLLERPAAALQTALDSIPDSAVWRALRPSLEQRLTRMERLGLAHLSLARTSGTLSGGEAQRLRLAAQLSAGLGRQLIALDEPTLGLHPTEQDGMRAVLDELRELGNTLLVVEHDPDMVRHADWLVRLGPGAGPAGGEVLESGPLADSSGAQDDAGPLGSAPQRKANPRTGRTVIRLRGATLHNLREADLDVHVGTFNVVIGASGAGKSSLVFGTLLPALLGQARPGTGLYRTLEGAPSSGVQAVDARPIGRTPRSTPATWSGLFDLVRKRFAGEPDAVARDYKAGRFSYNNKEGRCPACEGLGFRRIGLHLLEDLELECEECLGGRYAPATLAVTHRGLTIAEVLALNVSDACTFFEADEPIAALCRAMNDLGLGYLSLGQASNQLSRGEAQRVKLATLLGTPGARESLLLLDEPDRGLHPSDVNLLLQSIDALVEAGHTVVAISHHRHVWAAADHVTQLSDGVARPVREVELAPLSQNRSPRAPARAQAAIRLTGVRTHNLRGIDVRIPHGRLTALAGVSGSGKTSLAFDTLASEAWHRFSESLPFQVRRFTRRSPRPALDNALGLGPTLSLRQGQARAGERSTVATQSEIGPLLRLLWSRAGTRDGQDGDLTAAHFSPENVQGACLSCEGRGVVSRCAAERLVTHPDRSLADGALSGTRPGKFFTERGGQHLATLQAAVGANVDLDRAWSELGDEVRRIALAGAGETVFSVRWEFQRGKRSGQHVFEGPWEGFLKLVEREARRRAGSQRAAEWRTPLVDARCSACGGTGLREEIASVAVGTLTFRDVMELALSDVLEVVEAQLELKLTPGARAVVDTLLPELRARVDDLLALGLGHLSLGRRSRTLSEGELQRTRIASLLRSGLTGVTFVLDEPGAGLHTRDLAQLLERLAGLRDEGNTIVVVSHRPEVLRAADHLIELGPGAGEAGGLLVGAGEPSAVLNGDGPTASALRAGASQRAEALLRSRQPREVAEWLRVSGARANNLKNIDLELPAAGFVCVTGVSGSGKSSLIFEVLGASHRAGAPVQCDSIELVSARRGTDAELVPSGLPGWALAAWGDLQSSRDLDRGQTVLSTLKLLAPLQALFHAQSDSLPKAAFSYNSPAGRCDVCRGSGLEEVAMDFMADLALPCAQCAGRRYRAEVLAVAWEGLNIAEFLERPVDELRGSVPDGPLQSGLEALSDVGLGYVALGRRRRELSGGEAQRLTLAAGLGRKAAGVGRGSHRTLYLFDEPATGLHELDLVRLVAVFRRLTERGHLIIAAEHRPSLIAAADWEIGLGPGSGQQGGSVVNCGAPRMNGDRG